MTIKLLALCTSDSNFVSTLLSAASAMGIQTDSTPSYIQASIRGNGVAGKVLPLKIAQEIADHLDKLLEYDINNNPPDRDSASMLFSRVPLAISSPEWKRSTPRNWIYDIATAKNVDGSKKYPLVVTLHTLAAKVNFDTTGDKPKATGVDYLHGEVLYRADPRSNPTGQDGMWAPSRRPAKRFGIPVNKDLPGVGGNLQDRYETGATVAALTNFQNCVFLSTPDDPGYLTWAQPNPSPLARGSYATDGIAMGIFLRSLTAGPDQDLWVGSVPGLYKGYFLGMGRTVITPKEIYFTGANAQCAFAE
ncbi:hypothetical protein F5Y11DRAFT_362625 [Daldinia sp. FL1419]|nr:hypothetical protein F5Y11DRAFT_362625 [Daldinia sp. FL1419]